jgi:hypothetical protein
LGVADLLAHAEDEGKSLGQVRIRAVPPTPSVDIISVEVRREPWLHLEIIAKAPYKVRVRHMVSHKDFHLPHDSSLRQVSCTLHAIIASAAIMNR